MGGGAFPAIPAYIVCRVVTETETVGRVRTDLTRLCCHRIHIWIWIYRTFKYFLGTLPQILRRLRPGGLGLHARQGRRLQGPQGELGIHNRMDTI